MSSEIKAISSLSLNEIWEKVIARFQDRTGQRLDGVSRSLDDLQRALDTHYAEQKDVDDVSKRKKTGLKIMQCIQLLGRLAAQGASVVFSPAGCCFNALSCLLDIPKSVRAFHEEIDGVIEDVGPALAQFRIYQRVEERVQIDESLRVSLYMVIASFVDLCADCIAIHRDGRWKRLKRTSKRVLLDDTSIIDAFDKFKRYTHDQLNIQVTLTLEAALETREYMSFLETTKIAIDETTKVIKIEVFRLAEGEHKRTLDDLRKQHLSLLKNTGKWLDEVDDYKHWIGRDSLADPLLLLTQVVPTERNLIGYYSFSLVGKADSERKRPEAAIKSICTQLAEQGQVYAKQVADACAQPGKDEKYFRDASCCEIWTVLGIGAPAKNTTHYVLLHSINILNEQEIDRLMEAIDQEGRSNPVRILLSLEPATVKEGRLGSTSRRCVVITQRNEVDIERFINEELQKAHLFQGDDEDSQRQRCMVEERLLLKRSSKCFLTVLQDLRKIKEIISSGGIEDLVCSNVEILEAVLKPREIDELNELLICIVAGYCIFDVEDLAAALSLRFNTVPLQPLKQKITEKYSKILSTWRSILLSTVTDPGNLPTIPKSASPSVSRMRVPKRCTFQPGSDFSSSGNKKIRVYNVDAHFEIVKRAFSFFSHPPTNEVLYEATGVDKLQPADRQFIASNVYDMFNEGDMIEKNWEFGSWTAWNKTEREMEMFWEWLNDPVAIGCLGPRDKIWLAEMKEDKNPYRRLLTPIMTVIARDWLKETKWEHLEAYKWIGFFLILIKDSIVIESDKAGDDGEIVIYSTDSIVEKAAALLEAQDPADKSRLRDVYLALGNCFFKSEAAIDYLKLTHQQDEGNAEVICALLTESAILGKTESIPVVRKAIGEKTSGEETILLVSIMTAAVKQQQGLQSAIGHSRTDNKEEDLAVLLLPWTSRRELSDLETHSLHYLGIRAELEQNAAELRALYENHQQIPSIRNLRLVRSEVVDAFNILSDDDIGNDIHGFIPLRTPLTSMGDDENARRASLMIPAWKFNREVLRAIFANKDLLHYPDATQDIPKRDFIITRFHVYKYCYRMDLCKICCYNLQSSATGKVLIYSKLHDWYELQPWIVDSYVHAWERLILVKNK
ncbi:hypothetical protein BJX70DRAFT_386870 [Aspergillus crustosus]